MANNMIANRYEVFKHIGQGGMADVFLAMDTILNREVAIKILRSELCADPVSVVRFEREAQAATTLSHPNIVEIYDVGEYKGHRYIVMEYVPGRTLKQVIRSRGSLEPDEAIDIEKQLVSAVSEAHHKGIIHRDIKPQNIIVKSDGSIKILDFGIAIAKGNIQVTQANNVMGSVHYLAPELAKGKPASVQSDIYALGIVLFEMLSGDVPFKADSAVQVALMQMRNEMPSIRTINPSIPQSIENIITRATAKDPSKRYGSCVDMLDDLRTCFRRDRINERKLVLSPRQADREQGYNEENVDSSKDKVVKPAVAKKKNNNILLKVVVAILVLLASVGGVYGVIQSGIFDPKKDIAVVPDLLGRSITEAKDLCIEANLVLDTSNITYTLTDTTSKGQIIETDPVSGTEIEKGSRIKVTVSSGIAEVADNYIGWNITDATSDIASKKNSNGIEKYKNTKVTTVEETSEDSTPGEVIKQELLEPGTRFNPDNTTEIRLVYASYPTIVIPGNLEGMSIEEAEKVLQDMGAMVLASNLDTTNLKPEEIENLQTGVVIKTDPELGSEYTQREDNYIILYYY
ncbi:MAG: Stk1 family PASTA domain-containing Ser/Thr kinase [Bulleidia sp.]|nr:Stk1 family PASTA domain-containing Ser/Thr kinase [Erysipelotrichaceae bacterium]MDY2780786.1 Stk1 family PASTA domain-containing Ser/Thr kinase [Bulleidia sp.]